MRRCFSMKMNGFEVSSAKLKCFIGALLCIVCHTSLYGQLKIVDTTSLIYQPNRIEFEITARDLNFEIIPADDQGMLVIRQTSIKGDQGFIWGLYRLDTALNQVWRLDISVEFGHTFLGYDFNGESFFLLFGKNEYKQEEMEVIKVDRDGGEANGYQINTVLPLTLSHFETVGHSLIFGGESSSRPVVVYYNLDEKKPKVLPGVYNNKSRIVDIVTNDEFGVFTVVLNERTITKDITLSIKMFTKEGRPIYNTALKSEYEKSLIDGVPTTFDGGVQYIAGTYSNRNMEVSRGLYLAKIEKGEQQFIKYHSYADLENFFSYLDDKQEQKMNRKVEKKKMSGKEAKLNYRMMIHDIVKRDDEYVLIGEVYYPKYTTSTTIPTGYSGGYGGRNSTPPTTNVKVLEYKFTHAVLVSFNDQGDVIWDNSFEINDVLIHPLTENIQVSVEKEKIALMYTFDDGVKTTFVKEDSVLEGKSVKNIKLKYEFDELRPSESNLIGLKKWYGNSFYAYGMHRIKNSNDRGVKMNRKVFYINKIHY